MSDAGAAAPGFFGKVRTHGDFVTRRLPTAFVAPWDAWLQRGMGLARQQFGERWLPAYLNAPVWCFALGAQVCGPMAWAGVLMPGVDRVGRHFPLTIASPFDADELAGWLRGAQAWFDEVTRAALSTLGDGFVLDHFDAVLERLVPSPVTVNDAANAWRLTPMQSSADTTFGDVLAASIGPGTGVWWSDGSDAVPASLLAGPGLPEPPRFAALFDADAGAWPTMLALRSS
jgi:type VI secretion system protein ImpM